MRVATFNIASGRGADGVFDLDRFAAVIAGLDADVLALQEVDRDQPRSGGADLTAWAASAMGAVAQVFAPTLFGTPGDRWTAAGGTNRAGPAYGCALLSRVPLRDLEILRIPAAPVAVPLWAPGVGRVVLREEPRVAIVARAELRAGAPVTVAATHLPFVPGWKHWQLARLARELQSRPDPLLLLGDLNVQAAATRLTGYRALARAPTFPAARPRLQLDHVLLRGPLDALGRVTATAAPAVTVSDHRPLLVDVDVGGAGGAAG
ncbi:endonuclease/exonuclease/phosphatase family protein [Nakamurella leprariae]|uniref:Endonuclease/exonuclease/phosphatase family protein n=1 Tax=Nakamurella leprariae TaxID=2803911 RepID=A0A939C311_9ACTN|nr:endonuclease/exonuclease/phosphatase family protein [Nakamurella leprariae]MBM9468894.1 endonuclease/exonuclease/phosphatase family protein [Nakamurella leprariae]